MAVGYIEIYGTGTQAGNKTEIKSITSVFAPENGCSRAYNIPLYIRTVKSNVGYGEAAASIIVFIKIILVFQKAIIPLYIGIKIRLNPSLPDLTNRNMVIPYTATSWEPGKKPRLVIVNNFGAAGRNISIIVKEAKLRPRIGEDTRQV